MTWWAESPHATLSQGDVIRDVPVAVVRHPLAQLTRTTVKGGEAWSPSGQWAPDEQGMGFCLGRGRVLPVLVITDSCQLDKRETKERVLVAPVYAIGLLRQEDQLTVLAQGRRSKMPLPDLPNLGSSYADLRMVTAIDSKFLDVGRRVAQLSDEGVGRLQAQLVGFFTGVDARALFAALVSMKKTVD